LGDVSMKKDVFAEQPWRTARPGSVLVFRPRLVARLEQSSASVVLVCAPSGYGKSVLIGQWAEQDPRPFPTVILGAEHNDAALLVASIIAALEPVEPVPTDVEVALANPDPSMEKVVLPRLRRALEQRKLPFVLVLDDVERIESPRALGVISAIMGTFPGGSKLVLVTRTEPALPVGRLRAHRELTELSFQDLKMSTMECQEVLLAIGLQLSSGQLETVVARTEGWPAALYLAGMALIDAPDLATAIARFAGDDRFVVDYISDEFLGAISGQRLEFLRRASVLDRLSGDLCDVVLQQRGSATELHDLSHSNILLAPLDRHDEWFRFHPLFREMLRAELRRVTP
jgi:LuxR family transcriptional regulator, maltose regulon positive regulatory protein